MTVEVTIDHVFPTPIYKSRVNVDNLFIDDVECVSNGPDHLVLLSKTDDLLEEERFSFLKNQIDHHVRHFYHDVLGYAQEVYPSMTTSWLVKSLPGQESEWHCHGNSVISGVVYLNSFEDCGNILFKEELQMMKPLHPPIQSNNIFNTRMCFFTPQRGLILLFPSTLFHKVDKNRSNYERISIAFNYFLKGNFKSKTANLTLR